MPWQRPNRFWRHVFTDERDLRRAFTNDAMDRIERAIQNGETQHRGQVAVAIESALPLLRVLRKLSPRERAIEVFGQLRVWDTEENNGVLVYLLLADHDVEIVADRGIDRKVGDARWQAICTHMEQAFRDGRFVEGLELGVREISAALAEHFPGGGGDVNEIGDRVVVL
ncbi:MAG TPA: TPM domain-containing protein [Casimicrobiaceae bacterium]|nr:TPM domain-containing protein [Casimicrobiaceae bacterium]